MKAALITAAIFGFALYGAIRLGKRLARKHAGEEQFEDGWEDDNHLHI